MDKAILGYAAGLFDGEGCVTYKQYYEKKKLDLIRHLFGV